jgi:hypothetical protein
VLVVQVDNNLAVAVDVAVVVVGHEIHHVVGVDKAM